MLSLHIDISSLGNETKFNLSNTINRWFAQSSCYMKIPSSWRVFCLVAKKVVNLDLRMSFIWGTMFRVQVIWYIKIT